jgi:fructosamine-3-kinase
MVPAAIESLTNAIAKEFFSQKIHSIRFHPVCGGSINNCYRITVNGKDRAFIKFNSSNKFPLLFEKEKNGLQFLAAQNVIRIPEIIHCDIVDETQVLLLEWIDRSGPTEQFWKKLGEQLANLHYVSHQSFGFAEDNYMGALPQANDFSKSWTDFFILQRLQPQIKMAIDKRMLLQNHITMFEKLYAKLNDIFNPEAPSLLHGDLWNGNLLCDENNSPVLIDPAVYFGHRGIDLGMTTLFGGFDPLFYESYRYHYPLPGNFHEQWEVCNLYPLLIHLNLFGRSYLNLIESILKKFTA